MNRNQLTFKNFLVVILPGALAFFGLEYLMYSLTGVSAGLTPVYDYFIIDPVLWIVLAFTAGLLVNGVSIVIGRLFQRMFFGQQTGTWLLSRNSRESGVLKNRLAHGAGHSFDRNFKSTFDEVFRNYFRYETAISNLRDNLCYNALGEHSPHVAKRLDGLASSARLRLNLGLTLIGFALASAAVALYTGGGLNLWVIAQIGGCFILGLGLLYSYLSQTAVYYHELYTSFYAMGVEKDVQRQTVKAGRTDSRSSGSSSSRGGRGRSRGRSRSGSSSNSGNRQNQSSQSQSQSNQNRSSQNRSSQSRRSTSRGGRPPHNRQSQGGGSSSSGSGGSQQSSQSDS